MEENAQPTSSGENENQQQTQQQGSEQEGQQQQQSQEQPQPQEEEATANDDKDVEENKAITYLSYIGLLFLVPMLAKKDSQFAQFHAKQGLVLTVGWFIGCFLYIVFFLGGLVHLAIIVLSIMGLVNVSKGEKKDLPIVGDLAKKFNL
ncbi:MAG: hypothetical protein U9M90_01510 [Patescibacteria group bacterium]|nr:hypothetical protein [Patescibacteria group bacterium]